MTFYVMQIENFKTLFGLIVRIEINVSSDRYEGKKQRKTIGSMNRHFYYIPQWTNQKSSNIEQ